MTSPTNPRTWAVQGSSANPERGICSLTYKGSTLRFRTNPNLIKWSYHLNTHVDTTYGGRVVQLLSTNIGDLRVVAEAGGGRWSYLEGVSKWFRDLLIEQRSGEPAEFAYTSRGWKLKVFAQSIPFQDRLGDTLRAFEMQFKVQEDVTGIMSQMSLSQEMARLREGIGFKKGKYNQPMGNYDSEVGWVDPASAVNQVTGIVSDVASVLSGLAGQIGQLMGPGNPSAAPQVTPTTTTPAAPLPPMTNIFGNVESGGGVFPPGSSISGQSGYEYNSTSSGG